ISVGVSFDDGGCGTGESANTLLSRSKSEGTGKIPEACLSGIFKSEAVSKFNTLVSDDNGAPLLTLFKSLYLISSTIT
ncbi:hypothetical protein WICPIJ_006426, partial [Wickerhamomyces pijperi]